MVTATDRPAPTRPASFTARSSRASSHHRARIETPRPTTHPGHAVLASLLPSLTALAPALTPETTAAPDGSTKGQASSLPRRHTAPGARLLTVYGWRGNGHLPALLRRSLEPFQCCSIAGSSASRSLITSSSFRSPSAWRCWWRSCRSWSCDPRAASLLRTYREARGWTVSEAAKQTGVSRRMVGMLEAAQRRPSESTADILVGAYRITGEHADQVRAIAIPFVGRDSPYRTGVTPGPW